MRLTLKRRSGFRGRRGAAILEYVILAVGIAIFVTFGVLKFGKAAQHQLDQATQVLSGVQDADVFDRAQQSAGESAQDTQQRQASNLGRD